MVKRLLPLIAATTLFASAAYAQVPPPGQLVSGWTGSVTKQIKTDSSGRLEVIGSASGGPSYGPDAVNTAPTQPPLSTGCYATSSGPSAVTSGRIQYVSCDLDGNVRISATTAVPVSQSGTWNINNISGTVSLPTGAATAALQTTGNTSLASIVTNTTGVSTAANQATANASLASIVTNTTGLATAANQATANASLATIATNTANLQPGSAGTLSTVACSTSSVTVLASNSSRKKATIFFDGVPTVYVTQSSTAASSTAYTLKATDGGYYEITGYTGQINAICSAATGNLRVTSIQ